MYEKTIQKHAIFWKLIKSMLLKRELERKPFEWMDDAPSRSHRLLNNLRARCGIPPTSYDLLVREVPRVSPKQHRLCYYSWLPSRNRLFSVLHSNLSIHFIYFFQCGRVSLCSPVPGSLAERVGSELEHHQTLPGAEWDGECHSSALPLVTGEKYIPRVGSLSKQELV